jgi:glycosidase
LVAAAKKNGMHIVLDGVFNHVSDDSIYFDRYYKFVGKNGKVGAYPYWAYVYDYMAANTSATQADAETAAKTYFKTKGVTDFSYTQWFNVLNTTLQDTNHHDVYDTIGDRAGKKVYNYMGWSGYDSMPVITATNGSEYQTGNWGSEIISGSNSTTQYWISQGSNGWRLDVANEVSDETWQKFRESVKSLNSDNVIIGEIWGDASKYLLGDMYDSVMNYQFRTDVLNYATGTKASDTTKALEKIREKYPKEAYYALMNLVGSHDTTRLLSSLDGIKDDRVQTDTASAFPTYATTSSSAKARQYMVALLQMTYAGAPTIYYGDEIGMVGADDPDDRRGMTWGEGNKDIVEWYAKLAAIRSAYSALRTGAITPLDSGNDAIMSYLRSDNDAQLIVATNNSDKAVTVALKTNSDTEYTDLITNNKVTSQNGQITVSVPAYSGVIYANKVKTITVNTNDLKPAYDSSYIVSSNKNPPTDGYVASQNIINSNEKVTVDLTKGSTKLSAAQMSSLIELNKTKPVTLNGENYSITFAANTMKQVQGQTDFDLGVTFNSGTNYSKIKGLAGSGFVLTVSYNYSGSLPAEATIRIKVGTQYAGKTLYYYYYNSATGKLEYLLAATVGQDGYISVKQTHCSEYVLSTINLSKDDSSKDTGSKDAGTQNSPTENKTNANPICGDNKTLLYAFGLLSLVSALSVFATRKKESNE